LADTRPQIQLREPSILLNHGFHGLHNFVRNFRAAKSAIISPMIKRKCISSHQAAPPSFAHSARQPIPL
jgi:hypothetical protein